MNIWQEGTQSKLYSYLFFGSALVISGSVNADIVCGGTITTPEVLTGNFSCNSGVIVTGPTGSLNLNGFTFDCEGGAGVILEGTGAVLSGGASGGTLDECGTGVIAAGSGSHTITGITFSEVFGEGVFLDSDNNTLSGSIIDVPIGGEGVFIRGSNSTVINNEIVSSDGFGESGIFFDLGADNSTVISNKITGFSDYGMEICSNGNFIAQNTVELTGFTDPIPGTAVGISLAKFAIPICFFFDPDSQFGNVIIGNIATDNNSTDLEDTNPFPCLNTWFGNTADNIEGACIDQ
ncbi:right-handed parallel beta-helix repeat-containing protein [Microbulbifer sp. JTAC008]|uniref:right-handed parallel beta-helix repeat-containing protein n=1 Tax=unclassified Microbulbifer TaxID=2619833 RepID=UPI0040396C2B